MPIAPEKEQVSPEWSFVQELLRDLQAEEDRAQLAYLFGQWRLSIRAFRRVEARRLTAANPTAEDLLFHRACVTELMSFGTVLQISARTHPAAELAACGVRLDLIEAILRDLHNTFDEWHAQIPESRIKALSSVIFDATPAGDLAPSRA